MRTDWTHLTIDELRAKRDALETYLGKPVKLYVWCTFIDRKGYVFDASPYEVGLMRKTRLTIIARDRVVWVRPFDDTPDVITEALFVER
jgi:hypothetical protein